MSSPQARRRQRSTRLTVAVGLLVLAALAVLGAVLSGSWPVVAVAAALGVGLGAAATRITHSELLQERRDAAQDRAAQARAYRDLTVTRALEHAEFTAAVQARADQQDAVLAELEEALSAAQARAAETARELAAETRRAAAAEADGRRLTTRLGEAEERAAEAIVRVAELEVEVDALHAQVVAGQTESARRHA